MRNLITSSQDEGPEVGTVLNELIQTIIGELNAAGGVQVGQPLALFGYDPKLLLSEAAGVC